MSAGLQGYPLNWLGNLPLNLSRLSNWIIERDATDLLVDRLPPRMGPRIIHSPPPLIARSLLRICAHGPDPAQGFLGHRSVLRDTFHYLCNDLISMCDKETNCFQVFYTEQQNPIFISSLRGAIHIF